MDKTRQCCLVLSVSAVLMKLCRRLTVTARMWLAAVDCSRHGRQQAEKIGHVQARSQLTILHWTKQEIDKMTKKENRCVWKIRKNSFIINKGMNVCWSLLKASLLLKVRRAWSQKQVLLFCHCCKTRDLRFTISTSDRTRACIVKETHSCSGSDSLTYNSFTITSTIKILIYRCWLISLSQLIKIANRRHKLVVAK